MHPIVADLTTLCQKLGYSYQLHSFTQALSTYKKIETRYAISHSTKPLWEKLVQSSSIYSPAGWQWVADFVQNRPVFLFLEPREKGEMLELTSGMNLTSLLAESTGFVFYLTNDQLSYLLAYNDHNFLIGTGEARRWVQTLLP